MADSGQQFKIKILSWSEIVALNQKPVKIFFASLEEFDSFVTLESGEVQASLELEARNGYMRRSRR